jgi:hypothetical protein
VEQGYILVVVAGGCSRSPSSSCGEEAEEAEEGLLYRRISGLSNLSLRPIFFSIFKVQDHQPFAGNAATEVQHLQLGSEREQPLSQVRGVSSGKGRPKGQSREKQKV